MNEIALSLAGLIVGIYIGYLYGRIQGRMQGIRWATNKTRELIMEQYGVEVFHVK